MRGCLVREPASMKLELCHFITQFFAHAELDDAARRDAHLVFRGLGVAPNLGFDFFDGEGAKVAQHDTLTMAEGLGADIDGRLGDAVDFAGAHVEAEFGVGTGGVFFFRQ